MTDIRRTVLWVVFSASLFFIWDAWQRQNGHPSFFSPPSAPVAAPAGVGKAPTGSLPGASTLPGTTPQTATAAAGAGATLPGAAARPSETVTVTTDLVRATADSTGGTLVYVDLLKQADPFDATKSVVLLDRSANRFYVAESGLVPAAGGAGLPNHQTPMHLMPGERTLAAGQDLLKLRFESDPVGGVKLAKTYTFKRGDYVIDVLHEVVNTSDVPVSPRLYLQLVRDGNPPPSQSGFLSGLVASTFTGPATYSDSARFKKIDFKAIEKRETEGKLEETSADSGWVAMVQHYYTSAWLIDRAGAPPIARTSFTKKVDTNEYSVGMIVPLGAIAAGASKSFDARLFIGPQEEDKLTALAPGLELVKDYGIFKILAEPLFWLLENLHKIIGNWGWSIVGLVVILKALFFWLNAKAYSSMAKMKAINPRIMEMRARLKDKPQQMQQEMMRIYKEEKVNPLGGCLPIVVQMPFFISLYWVLLSSVEMRGAPWIGWITDLSAKDPYFILPLLMTGTSLLQTWLNPTPADPVQAKMMWIMPLIFSVMFFVFPAGLVLYWLTNNILSIAQQYVINKRLGVIGK